MSAPASARTPLHHRLRQLELLECADFQVLDGLLSRRETAAAGELVVMENQALGRARLLLDGWAYRYKSFADGRRQILNFLVPGDVIGFYALLFKQTDSGVEAITPLQLAVMPVPDLVTALTARPKLTLAMSWIAGQSERILHEQITRIGRRNAAERLAHLFVELHLRLRTSGMDGDQACRLPLTQNVIADALGMSHVHANRSFRVLQRAGSVELSDGVIRLLDVRALGLRARFDRAYLEPRSVPPDTLDAVENAGA